MLFVLSKQFERKHFVIIVAKETPGESLYHMKGGPWNSFIGHRGALSAERLRTTVVIFYSI